MSNPTAQEQEFLELTNRMRMAPQAELDLLLNSPNPTTKASIDSALAYFKTNTTTLKGQWANLVEVAPLAWSDALNNSAAAHNQAMIAADTQSHQLPGEKSLGARANDAGYDFTSTAENVFTSFESPLQGEAALAIDWGMDDPSTPVVEAVDGIQNPAGHRNIILSAGLREVGISIIAANDPTKKNVGPSVLTQDFGNRAELDGKAYILGVAFDDTSIDGYYQAGEGLADVNVKITNIATKVSQLLAVGTAGGYQQLVDPGDYEVEFSRGGVVVQTATTSISAKDPQNVKLDFVVPNVIVQNVGPAPETIKNPIVNNSAVVPVTPVEVVVTAIPATVVTPTVVLVPTIDNPPVPEFNNPVPVVGIPDVIQVPVLNTVGIPDVKNPDIPVAVINVPVSGTVDAPAIIPTVDIVKKNDLVGSGGNNVGVSGGNPLGLNVNNTDYFPNGLLPNPLSPSILPVVKLGEYLQNGKSGNHLFDFTKNFTGAGAVDLKSAKINVNFSEVKADASYHNYAGLYRVDDVDGTVDGFKPGDAGYTIAALKRSKEAGQDVEFDRQGHSENKSLKGGYIYAPFVVADGNVDQVLTSKDADKAPRVYFNYIAANGDKFDHIKSLGGNQFAFEDTWGGGDKDYNDLTFKIDANVVSVVG
jgi:uncharacterized protein YkwD